MATQNSKSIGNLIAKLEALLFLYGEPMAYKKIGLGR